ncbi:hypothetical protein, partial [Nocardia seriolae]|uniref:hypothetical protein n=1 Tax=Nocardia seriolae TaxID=37332 RepID=UPI001E289035
TTDLPAPTHIGVVAVLTGTHHTPAIEIQGPQADLLGWLTGRLPVEQTTLTATRPHPIPPAPTWI